MQHEHVDPARLAARRAGRRSFVAGAAGLGLAAIAPRQGIAQTTEPAAEAVAPAAINDSDILNFALNLEYLEAEFYLRAAFGAGLKPDQVGGTGNLGNVTGGKKVKFKSAAIREYARGDRQRRARTTSCSCAVPWATAPWRGRRSTSRTASPPPPGPPA